MAKTATGCAAQQRLQGAVGLFDGADVVRGPGAWKVAAAMISIAALTRPATPMAMATSTSSKRNSRRLQHARLVHHDAALGEGRVQEDGVRHDGGAQDAGGQQHALGALELGHDRVVGHMPPIRPVQDRLDHVAEAPRCRARP